MPTALLPEQQRRLNQIVEDMIETNTALSDDENTIESFWNTEKESDF